MNKYIFTLISTFLAYVLMTCSACSRSTENLQEWMEPNGKVKVLSTIAMIDDLVAQIGGDRIDHILLIKGELDPHSYQLVKGDDEKLAFADIIFYNGLGLEHGPSLQSYLINHSKAVALGDKIHSESSALILKYKGQTDPHIWMDISLWMKTIPYIVEALSRADPVHEAIYRANGNMMAQAMENAHQKIREDLQEIESNKRYLVTSHDAFNYFAKAYLAEEGEPIEVWQERFAAPEGLAPESQLSTSDIQIIIDHLAKYDINVIFPESNVSRDSIRKIMQAGREKGLDIKIANTFLYADAMGKPGSDGDSYLKMIQHNAKAITSHLGHNGKQIINNVIYDQASTSSSSTGIASLSADR
jgi:manganese/zinc/iron transport system substrate-binding protein